MIDFLLFFKSAHIIGAVAWFSGLFLLGRLFVYHIEAFDKGQPDRDILTAQYKLMESRVYKIIVGPGMWITWIFGLLMVAAYIQDQGTAWLKANGWFHSKLLLVFFLTGFQHFSKSMMKKLAAEKLTMSSFKARILNEIPTIFLVLIVLLAVYRNSINYLYTLGGILVFGGLLYLMAKKYKDSRNF